MYQMIKHHQEDGQMRNWNERGTLIQAANRKWKIWPGGE
jgi:hypothetical protein